MNEYMIAQWNRKVSLGRCFVHKEFKLDVETELTVELTFEIFRPISTVQNLKSRL